MREITADNRVSEKWEEGHAPGTEEAPAAHGKDHDDTVANDGAHPPEQVDVV